MSRPVATVRILDTLPLSLTPNSDPRVIDGEVVVPRPDRKAWAVKAPAECPDCWSAGMITEIVKEPGQDPVRNLRPCTCVWLAIARAESADRKAKADGGVARAVLRPETVVERTQRRVERIRAELALAEETLHAEERKREKKLAPFLARVVEAVGQAEDAMVHDAACRGAVADSRRLADEAEATFREAREALDAALAAYQEATDMAEAAQQRLAPLALAVDTAKEAVRLAQNTGGERHRITVAQKRLEEMRARLQSAEADAAKVAPPAPEKAEVANG